MGKLLSLENARSASKLFFVYYQDNIYVAVEVRKKTITDAIALLPTPTPNFVKQIARNKGEAVQLVKDTQAEALLGSPL